MFTGGDDVTQRDVAQHAVVRGVAGIGRSLDLVDGTAGWSLSGDEARAALVEVTRLSARTWSVYLKPLAECARRDAPAAGKKAPARTGRRGGRRRRRGWPSSVGCRPGGCGRTWPRPRRWTHTPVPLRTLGADLATGTVTGEHASIAVRALAQIPVATRAQRRADIDARLSCNARRFTPPVTTMLARHLLEPPRVSYRVWFHGRVDSCQHRGSTRTSCGSVRSGLSPRR